MIVWPVSCGRSAAGKWASMVTVMMWVALMADLHACPAAKLCNIKVVTDGSPDYTDIGSLIHSVTSNWADTKDKCWALWYWNHVARRQTSPMIWHGRELTDPIRQFNDYGYTMCSTASGLNCAIWGAMGLHVKFWDISLHTVSEVEYDDRWHMYDSSLTAIYTLCDGSTIAGVEDIGAEGACAASGGRREAGHIARYHCLTATSSNGFLTGCDTLRSLEDEYRCFHPRGLKYREYLNNWQLGHRHILNLSDHDGQDIPHMRRLEDRWVTYGSNLAEHKPYACSVPSRTQWDAGDPTGTILTDGIVGPPYTGGAAYRYGTLWNERGAPVVTVDLGQVETCAAFRIQAGGYPWWDALQGEVRDRVEVLTSIDGQQYDSQGFFDFQLRWKDIPVNETWPDEETLCAPNYLLIPPQPVEARFVRYAITPRRCFSVSELQALDSISFRPFDLKLALPDGRDRSDISHYNPRHMSAEPRGAQGGERERSVAARPATVSPESDRAESPPDVADSAEAGELAPESPTLNCLGVRWLVGGDRNTNTRIAVAYRPLGSEMWKQGLDLFRVETAALREPHRPAAGQTLYAGSIFDLTEATDYEIRLTLQDPDGGNTQRLLKMTTWSEPRLAPDAVRVDVYPGQLAEALSQVQPGQTLCLHPGVYRGTFHPPSGNGGQPIGIVGAGEGSVILDGQGAEHIIDAPGLHDVVFENLTLQHARWAMAVNGGSNLVVRRCLIRDVDYGFVATRDGDAQHHILIADNVITGRSTWPRAQGIEERRGVQIAGTGNVVCFNRVSGFGDAIDTYPAYPCAAIDIYGNTSVKAGMPLLLYTNDVVSNCVHRNNLFLGGTATFAYESTAQMQACEYDFDGFGGRTELFLKWNGMRYPKLHDSDPPRPVYRHAVWVRPETAFESGIQPPQTEQTQFPPDVNDLRLSPECEAIDAGVVLPNINDGYRGKAPDLGAFERGQPLPHFGPRPQDSPATRRDSRYPSGRYPTRERTTLEGRYSPAARS